MEYTLSLFGQAKSRFLEGCDQSQPVLQAELIQIRRNFLDKADAKDFEEYKHEYHICPEPLALSKVRTKPSYLLNRELTPILASSWLHHHCISISSYYEPIRLLSHRNRGMPKT